MTALLTRSTSDTLTIITQGKPDLIRAELVDIVKGYALASDSNSAAISAHADIIACHGSDSVAFHEDGDVTTFEIIVA